MSGKAKNRKTYGKKIKDQADATSTLYSLNGKGTVIASTKSASQGTINNTEVKGQFTTLATADLNMRTFDIVDVDRLKFATSEGAGSALTATDYGMEAIYASNNAYGIQIRIPEASSDTFKIYRGSQEEVSISQAGIIFSDSVAITSGSARKAKLVLAQYDSSSTPANPSSGTRTLFVDGTNSDNLSVKKSDGTVIDLEAGTSGANVNLSNLVANTAVNVHLLPSTSENKNLGSTTKEWATLYLSSGLYFGAGQNSSTLNQTDGLLFNITDDNDWYEFQIDGDRKMSIGDTKTIIDGDLEPDTDNTRDIGSTSKAWKRIFAETGMEILGTTGYLDLEGSSSYIVFSDGDDFKIKNASTGLEYEVATGDYHRFQVNNVTKFQVGGSSCSLDGGMFIGSADSVEVGYKVNNQALTVGSQGSMIHPYISNTENTPSDSDLNGWFGDQNGAVGIQYYSTSGQFRIWIRANGTWAKAFAT